MIEKLNVKVENTSLAAKGALAHHQQLRTPSMRKGHDEGKKRVENGGEMGGKKKKRMIKIVATTSFPAVDRPNADCWNAARSRQDTGR